MSSEVTAGEAFLGSRLNGDAVSFPIATVPPVAAGHTLDVLVPGGFHSERLQVPPASGTYGIWTNSSSLPDMVAEHGVRLLAFPLFIVRVISQSSDFADLEPAASRLDAVLHMAPPQTVILDGHTYTVQSCVRERSYAYTEHLIDIERRHLGGYYRLTISPF